MITILDCYTDEPAGLGVPPYLGTYPRYIAGKLGEVNYLTIDDLRLWKRKGIKKDPKPSEKTDIKTYNLTRSYSEVCSIINNTTEMIIIAGVHTPGKYLSAIPGTLKEISLLIKEIDCKKILTGPAVYGSATEGGKFSEKIDPLVFNQIKDYNFSYSDIKKYAVKGASIIKQMGERIIEIETSKGCSRENHCSFCTEPLKNRFSYRDAKDIIEEVLAFNRLGAKHFRLGKQTCYYSHPQAIEILKGIREKCSIETLHIDNVNPEQVTEEITKAIVKYCTSGNIAAFGVESFDPKVVKANNLNADAETVYKAVKIINKYGSEIGDNGMPKFLPGINLLYGLIDETKETNEHNVKWLKRILDEGLLIRRINIRQVDIFEGTLLYNTVGNKFIKKNKKYYWKWRNQIRQEIDNPMLKKLVPVGTILKDVKMEIYDGKTTFGRQIGTYPLIIGVKERLELGKKYNLRIKGHMLRSLVGEKL